MKRTVSTLSRLAVVIVLLLALLPAQIWAQGDGGDDALNPAVAAILAQLRDVYSHSATQSAYTIENSDESTQSTSVRRFTSGTYLMGVTIFESFVNLQTVTTDISATVNATDGYTATFATDIEQTQGLGFEYVRGDDVLSFPEDTESELELELAIIQIEDETYINTDETGCEFRVGVPEGWRIFADGAAVLEGATLSAPQVDDIQNSIDIATVATAAQILLQPDLVTGLDVLETEEIGDEEARRYLITFDSEAALNAQDIEFETILSDLEAAAGVTLSNPTRTVAATYTLEVLVGATSGLVFEQIATLQLDVIFTGVSGSSAAYDLTRTNTITLSGYGVEADLVAPALGVTEETCVQDTTIDRGD